MSEAGKANALHYLAQAHHCVAVARGKAKMDESALEMARRMVELAVESLKSNGEPVQMSEVPRGCVEGRANVRRTDWVK